MLLVYQYIDKTFKLKTTRRQFGKYLRQEETSTLKVLVSSSAAISVIYSV